MSKKVLIVEDQFLEANDLQLMLVKFGYKVCGIARSVNIAQEMLEHEKPDFVLLDIFLKGKQTGIDLAKQLKDTVIPFIYISANSNEDILAAAKTTEPYGFIVKPFREKDLLVTLEIAKYRHANSLEARYRREADLQKNLERIADEKMDRKQKLLEIGIAIQQYIPFDLLTVGLDDSGEPSFAGYSFLRIGYNEYQILGIRELVTVTGLTMEALLAIKKSTGKYPSAIIFNNEEFEEIARGKSISKLFRDTFQMKSLLSLPLQLQKREQFSFCFYSRRPDIYNLEHVALFHRLQYLLTRIIEKIVVSKEMGISLNQSNVSDIQVPVVCTEDTGFEGVIGRAL